jgi:hypothetical protein
VIILDVLPTVSVAWLSQAPEPKSKVVFGRACLVMVTIPLTIQEQLAVFRKGVYDATEKFLPLVSVPVKLTLIS